MHLLLPNINTNVLYFGQEVCDETSGQPKGTGTATATRAIALLEEGYQPLDVAGMLGVDRRSVRRWKATHRNNGEKGILQKDFQ